MSNNVGRVKQITASNPVEYYVVVKNDNYVDC